MSVKVAVVVGEAKEETVDEKHAETRLVAVTVIDVDEHNELKADEEEETEVLAQRVIKDVMDGVTLVQTVWVPEVVIDWSGEEVPLIYALEVTDGQAIELREIVGLVDAEK